MSAASATIARMSTSDSTRAEVFSRNLRRLLERDWLNQREAAERIGVSYKWMRRLCHQGLDRLDRRTEADLKKVVQHFGLRIADLWHEAAVSRLTPPPRQALIKWTGSKRRQAVEIVRRFPKRIATYFEPFVGGGSVLYRLMESGITVERFRCSDTCRPLIGLWRLVKDDPRQIVESYHEMWHRLGEKGAKYYHSIRDDFNESGDPLLFFFLLRTCRIGLVRFNVSGKFTSAYHHGSRGMTPDRVKGIVEDWSGKLRKHDVRFYVCDYRRIQSSPGDLLYLDPPYRASHQSRIYGKWIDFDQFFRWVRRQQGDYVLSLDGFVEEEDRRVEVPEDLFVQHLLLPNGKTSLPRINGAKAQSVRDSLYVRVRSPRRDRTTSRWERVLARLDRYCGERFIDIPKPEWTILAAAARSDEADMASIAGELARVCERYAPPCPQVSEAQRRSDFRRFLDSEDERVEVETDMEVGGLPIASEASKWSRLGCRFLNSWFLEIRNAGAHRSSPSLNEAWSNPGWPASILRTALLMRGHLNEVTAHAAASMRLHIPTMFRPTAAQSICDDFGNGGTVLDFSAGYGGNFLGSFGSRCQRYVGSTRTRP